MPNDAEPHLHPVTLSPIGVLRTPFAAPEGMPIQPAGAEGVEGRAEILPTLEDGLKDLGGFSHLILLYRFHHGSGYRLQVTPFMDTQPHGVFATRAPRRPNPIGLSVVRLLRVDGRVLHLADVDMLDGTPLLDIKPYVPQFGDCVEARTGWLEQSAKRPAGQRADDRFQAGRG